MSDAGRFDVVFAKVREALRDDDLRAPGERAEIEIHVPATPSRDDLDEIDTLRRIVIETTEPELLSFTST